MSSGAIPPLPNRILPTQFANKFGSFKTTVLNDATTSRNFTTSHQIRTLAWSPLGQYIATGSGDRTLRIWNPERPNVKYSTELRGHQGAIERVAFNPTKVSELATCSADGTVKIWDMKTATAVGEVKTGGECFSLAWHPFGKGLLLGRKVMRAPHKPTAAAAQDVAKEDSLTQDDYLLAIDYPSLKILSTEKQPTQTNQGVFTWVGKHVFVTDGKGHIKWLRWPSLEHVYTIEAHSAPLFAADMSPNGDFLAVGGSDSIITLWDYTGWFCKRSFSKMTGPVKTISFSWDSAYIVGGSDEGTGLEIADVYSGEYVHHVETGSVASAPVVQWSPSNYHLAYSWGEGTGGLRVIGNIDQKAA